MADERDVRTVWAGCERAAAGFDARARQARSTLLALAERAGDDLQEDRYGEGDLAERLEQRVAALLGKEAAVWMPSGTMAQQIALRIHADRRGRKAIAFHPFCHIDLHEERGYELLHGLHAAMLGEQERPIAATDVEAVREPFAALLVELPQRDLGGVLPAWDELEAMCATARERGAAAHLDGARLWQCTSYYERSLDEIAGLFDTVYVSFYKDLGAPAGCALAGPHDVVDEARVWQVRHGGRLFTAYPYMLAAERGLDEVLPRMDAYVERARELGALLASLDGLSPTPDPPQTAMLHVLADRPLDELREATLDVAEEASVWFTGNWGPTKSPDVQWCELSIGESSFAVSLDEMRELWVALLGRSSRPTSAAS